MRDAIEQVGDRMADRSAKGAKDALFPLAILEFGFDTIDQLLIGEPLVVENRTHEKIVIAPANAFDHREIFISMHSRRTQEDKFRNFVGIPRRVGEDDLSPKARTDKVVGGFLNELIEEDRQSTDEIIDGDLAPGVEMTAEFGAVVHENLGDFNVEMPRPRDAIGEPAFGLFGESVDQNQRLGGSIRMESRQE